MRLLVVGAGFSNKGAEAMTLTVHSELTRRLGDVEMLLWDCPRAHVGLALRHRFTPLLRPAPRGYSAKVAWTARSAVARRGLLAENLASPLRLWPEFSAIPMLDEAGKFDALLDISGFAYGDAWGVGPAWSTLPAARHAREIGAPLVFMPQAWGPFANRSVLEAVRELTSGDRTLAFARDRRSMEYLTQVRSNLANTEYGEDIVFAFRGADGAKPHLRQIAGRPGDRRLVAIAPNMRAYERANGAHEGNEYVRTLVAVARYCVDAQHNDVLLLPAECKPSSGGPDDRDLCAIVQGAVGRPGNCRAIQTALSASEMRAIIGECEYVLASRFHVLVFALSQGVPCTALGWSHKYAELMSAFHAQAHCADVDTMDADAAVELYKSGWDSRVARREVALEVAGSLEAAAQDVFDRVATFLASNGASR
jgi:polysaccharide pyruvyl transferase WcaK-like protein